MSEHKDGEPQSAGPAEAHTRWNFNVIIGEAGAFLIGRSWVDPVAVLPLFIQTLTPSTFIVGLVTTLQRLGYTLPQLPMAAVLGHRPRRLPYLRWGVLLGRSPFLLFVIYLWASRVENTTATLVFMVVGLAAVSAGNGAVAVPWQDIIAKSIPSRLRGRFFGTMQFVQAVGALGVGLAVRWALGPAGPSYPANYILMFTMAGVFFTISTIGCWVVREPIRPVLDKPESMRELVSGGMALLKQHREFRSLVVVTFLAFGLNLTMPFYILHAKTNLGVPDEMAGIYIWAAVLSGAPMSLLWGHINDRRGPRAVLRGGCIMATLAPALALLIPWVTRAAGGVLPGAAGALPYVYALVFLVGGSGFGPLWMGSNNYLFELASHEDRHRYIALLATLTAPRTLFPVLTGAVLAVMQFELVFGFLVALGVGTIVVSWRLKRPNAAGSAGPR